MPLPQLSSDVHQALQPSPEMLFPSSQISLASRVPSPQLGRLQLAWQPSPLMLFPSSHSSSTSKIPLPQVGVPSSSTQPALQLYTGNGLNGNLVGKGGVRYARHAGVALEAQAYPNAVNTPHVPPVWLRPGETYRQVVEYRFPGQRG